MIKRGEIYWVSLDPTIGSEMKKTRPAVIVSNDLNNLHAATVTIVPISTSAGRLYPFEVALPAEATGSPNGSKAKANQVRTVDKQRLGKFVGMVGPELMSRVGDALRIHLEL